MSKTDRKMTTHRDFREWPSVKKALDPSPLLTDVERRHDMATPIKVMIWMMEIGKREFHKDDFLSYVKLLMDSGKYRLADLESVAFPWRKAFNRVLSRERHVEEYELKECLYGCRWEHEQFTRMFNTNLGML